MSLSDWLIWLVYFFFMVIYLMLLFRIVGDLFRRDDVGGWGKAGWIVALIFVPFLAMLIYVISQGNQMARREVSSRFATREQEADYIRSVTASPGGSTEEIKRAHELLQSGAITQAEFDALKAKALS
jgi:hypothetical protein